jgi:hypothetical protein
VFDDTPERLTGATLAEIYGGSGKWSRSVTVSMNSGALETVSMESVA